MDWADLSWLNILPVTFTKWAKYLTVSTLVGLLQIFSSGSYPYEFLSEFLPSPLNSAVSRNSHCLIPDFGLAQDIPAVQYASASHGLLATRIGIEVYASTTIKLLLPSNIADAYRMLTMHLDNRKRTQKQQQDKQDTALFSKFGGNLKSPTIPTLPQPLPLLHCIFRKLL